MRSACSFIIVAVRYSPGKQAGFLFRESYFCAFFHATVETGILQQFMFIRTSRERARAPELYTVTTNPNYVERPDRNLGYLGFVGFIGIFGIIAFTITGDAAYLGLMGFFAFFYWFTYLFKDRE
ncbi:hypothetical protein ABH15_00150 [Methanoculleus taiwanensis]|uniref:Uncharacterized protein n=1 Tax=Methanoculleus taiwanensis TaxID=1550565 RepID=A0A498H117_9EURY|nr:hypothetical protein ABH15_00150 [Methanoculleus taiwanensis]